MSTQVVQPCVSPLRRRMLEDMAMRGLREETRRDYIRFVRSFAAFLRRSPDTATAEDVRLFQVHQGFRLSYLDGDVAVDTMIYNTTSPDVTDVTADLHQMSRNVHGDDSLRIQFDGCVQWPFNWYLRDFPNRQLSSAVPQDPATGPDVIIGHPWDSGCGLPFEISGAMANSR